MTKKFLSMFLALAMCLSLAAPAGAMEDATAWSDRCTDNAWVFTPQEFAQLFSTDELATRSSNRVDSISYSYRMTKKPENSLFADVEMHITLNGQYPITVLGTVNGYLLSNNDILWEGPLDGTVTINNISYSVIVGFAKLESDNKIQASMTIQAVDPASEIGLIIFTFGDTVVTKETYQLIKNVKVSSEEMAVETEEENILRNVRAGSYTSLGFVTTNFAQGSFPIPETAQKATGFFDKSSNRLAVSIVSYTSNVDKYFKNLLGVGTLVETTIDSFSIELKRGSSTSNSYIAGIESFDFDIDNNSGKNVSLNALFEDIMGILGVPTSTISAIFDGLKGSVEESHHTDNTKVSVNFDKYQHANFDNSAPGVPIVFQLAKSTSSSTGSSSYTFTTSIRYQTVLLEADGSQMNFIYINGINASKNVSVTLG